MKSSLIFASVVMTSLIGHANTFAQTTDFPLKPIRIIVPFGNGSGSDTNARYYADKMGALLGQPVIVENKPGADATIGMMAAKAAPADGYTLVQGGISPSVVNAVVIPELGYDPVRDFIPILGYGRNMNVIVVPINSKYHTFSELVAAGQQTTEALTVGTFSTTLSLSAAWLGNLTQSKMINVPYKGQSQVMNDLMGNHLDFALIDLGGAAMLIREKKLRALAVTGEYRFTDFPDIPTVKESGFPEYVLYSWNALFVRAETPEKIRSVLAEAVKKVMTSEETINTLHKPRGTEPLPITAAQLQSIQIDEIERFRRIAKTVNFSHK